MKSSEEDFRIRNVVLNGVYILRMRQVDRILIAGTCLEYKMSLIRGLKIELAFIPKNFHSSSTFTPLLQIDPGPKAPFVQIFEEKNKVRHFGLRRCQIPGMEEIPPPSQIRYWFIAYNFATACRRLTTFKVVDQIFSVKH